MNLIALLATGDEIRNGDILNTNSQEIAYRLFNEDMTVGTHMVVGDRVADITAAIQYLLQTHRALIMTGGLGPTSDDLTRYALADAVERPLIFDDVTWSQIVLRLKNLGYETPPETNRQQALFPEGATIIPNPNGTASGCFLEHDQHLIFMLPGPPLECLHMLEHNVLPTLKQHDLQEKSYHQKWLLFGVSEGQIAEELDRLTQSYDCVTGYRLFYPYIEFKIFSHTQEDFATLVPLIEKVIAPYLIQDGKKTASELLKEKLLKQAIRIHIADFATGGSLEAILHTPKTHAKLIFSPEFNQTELSDLQVEIKGLSEFWQQKDTTSASFEMTIIKQQQKTQNHYTIPFRGLRTKPYAVEFICRKIVEWI